MTLATASVVAALPEKHSRYAAVATLLVSAAMVMRVDTSFRILGYPGFAMILFLMAGLGAGYLAVQIIRHDRSVHQR